MPKKEFFINTKIQVTPEQSEKLQKYLFKKEYSWYNGGKCVKYADKPFLFIGKDFALAYMCEKNKSYFEEHPYYEITMEDVFEEEYIVEPIDFDSYLGRQFFYTLPEYSLEQLCTVQSIYEMENGEILVNNDCIDFNKITKWVKKHYK